MSLRQSQLLKEDPIHVIGGMLTGMEDKVSQPTSLTLSNYRRYLNDLRTGPQHNRDLQLDYIETLRHLKITVDTFPATLA